MNEITKGPWKLVRYSRGGFGVRGKSMPVIWLMGGVPVEADARLMVAALDMLAALMEAVEKYGKPGGPWNVPNDPGGWITRARKAIAKAKTGGKPRNTDHNRKPSTISPSRRSADQ